jgi:purine-binding chemotaxis protein CheW
MDIVNVAQPAKPVVEARGGQFLSFMLASEEYAVEILRVREILGMCSITPLPNSPAHVQGVMNLRGTVVGVVDLRVALGLPRAEYNKFSVIIVLSILDRTMGFIVDSVCDVLSLATADVEDAPDLGSRVDASRIKGIGRAEGRFVILLDADRIAAPEGFGT